ncbi:hypothetical protein D3C72_1806390 [compost metagenome]
MSDIRKGDAPSLDITVFTNNRQCRRHNLCCCGCSFVIRCANLQQAPQNVSGEYSRDRDRGTPLVHQDCSQSMPRNGCLAKGSIKAGTNFIVRHAQYKCERVDKNRSCKRALPSFCATSNNHCPEMILANRTERLSGGLDIEE